MIATMSSLAGKRHRGEIYEERNKRTRVYSGEYRDMPEGWLDCPRFGQEIGCIIPSKVPLSESYNHCLPPHKTYTFKHWLYNGRKKLGLVIDLTNTVRYYNPKSELRQRGINYVKIPCSGRDAVPDNVSVNTFVNEVNRFEKRNGSNKYVLVHCTHGHNRTGFMIVHYLMRYRPMMTVTKALKTFSDARPPGIYKSEYVDALYSFYHEIKPERLVCPTTPEWKRSDNLNREEVARRVVKENNQEEENAKTMSNDDILGDEIPYDQEVTYQSDFYDMLKIKRGAGGYMYFPGSHPVSLDREQLQLLRQRYYYATWKADGTRYMMLLTREGCYVVDRKFRFRRVQMRFPRGDNNNGVHHDTVLDGEMVVDTLPDGHQVRRYLVYDLVAINGVLVTELPFRKRLNIIDKAVIKPRNNEKLLKNHWYRYEMEPFGVRFKAFCLLSSIENKLFKALIPSLTHEADGLIFQGWDDPYVPQRNDDLLKWKYPHMNSVDYLFEMTKDGHRMLFLYERGRKKLMKGFSVEFRGDGWRNPASYSGKILECSYDREKKVWVAMRIRVDKDKPNGIDTGLRVIKSINDNITEEILVQEIKEIIRLPMYSERIQMDSQVAEHRRHGNRKA